MIKNSQETEIIAKQESRGSCLNKNKFSHDVLKMISAPVLIQFLGIITLPIISRLYGPSAFGVYAIFGAIVGPIGVIICMSYDTSIMLPKSDEEASNMLAVSLGFTVFISLLSVPLTFLFKETLKSWFKQAPELMQYLWFIPVSLFFGGLYMTLRYWNMRNRRFGVISIANIFRFSSEKVFVIIAGFLGYVTGISLLIGAIIGVIGSPIILGNGIWHKNGQMFKSNIRLSEMLKGIKRYKKFPIYNLGTNFLSSFSTQVPIYLIIYFFSQSILGYYAFGLRILTLPMQLVGNSVGEVFFQRASKSEDHEILSQLLEELLQRLVFVGLMPFLILGLLGQELFTLAFGVRWVEAGIYAQIFSGSLFFNFITSPAQYLSLIFEKQELSLLLNVGIIFMTIVSLTIGGILGNVILSFILLSLSTLLVYSLYGFGFMHYAGLKVKKIFKILLRYIFMSLPAITIILIAKYYYHSSPLLLIIISILATIIYYLIGLRHDKKLLSIIIEILSYSKSKKL